MSKRDPILRQVVVLYLKEEVEDLLLLIDRLKTGRDDPTLPELLDYFKFSLPQIAPFLAFCDQL